MSKKKRASRREVARILSDPHLPYNQFMQIPGILYFPRKIVKDLEEIREYNEYTYSQLVA